MSATDDALDGCPSSERLAALAEGRLPPSERDPVERHIAGCALCRAIAAGLGHAAAPAPSVQAPATPAPTGTAAEPPRPSRRRLWLLLLVLAVVVLAIWWLASRSGGGDSQAGSPPAAPRDVDAEVAAAAQRLAAAHPDLFAGFTLLSGPELSATSDRKPDGIAVNAPRETVLATRPRFRWKRTGQAKVYALTLRGGDGKDLFTQRVEALASDLPSDRPDLARGGSYTWSVKARRGSGPVDGALAFRVASADEAARFEAQARAVRADVPADLADLLLAHVALRAGLLEEAERLLEPRDRAGVRSPLEQQTLGYVRVRLDTFPPER